MTTIPTDRLGRRIGDLRVSVTDRCNFRCPYCMPAEVYGEHYEFVPRAELLSFEEIERLVRIFVRGGVEKVRITGGEPLLRTQLPRLIERLAAIGGLRDLTLTTNGYLLAQHAQALAAAGLNRISVSLDAVDEETFGRMNGRNAQVAQVLAGVEAAAAAGLTPIKINSVIIRGLNDHTIVETARHFRGSGHILRFIEFMDVGTKNHWTSDDVVSATEIVETIDRTFPLEAIAPNYAGEVAERYRYKDGGGEVGVIASVTRPFCGQCTRARLSTDGRLVTCLFATDGTDLKDPLRTGASDDHLAHLISSVWSLRKDRYSEERAEELDKPTAGKPRIEMYELGG